MSRVVIVGAGAAGMMAAVAAASQGADVVLLEKMDQPGRKLRITGKGRCNLTNTASLKDFLSHIGPDKQWLRNCFAQFFNTQLMEFFEQRNVPLVEERGGRVYPKSGKSLDIFLALINDLERRSNVEIRRNCAVKSLTEDCHGVRLQDGTTVRGDALIIATGGLSYPTTGSTGIGYRLAQEAGHTVVPQVPSLVSLVCEEPVPQDLEGFVLKNVGVMAERNLIVAVFAGELDEFGAALRAAPVAVEFAAFLEATFNGDIFEEKRNLRVLLCHALQEFARSLVGKVALDVDCPDFAVRQELAHAAGKLHQEHAGILAAAYRDQHLVAVFNQVEVVQCLSDFLADAFADGVGHFFRLKRGSLSRGPDLICL